MIDHLIEDLIERYAKHLPNIQVREKGEDLKYFTLAMISSLVNELSA